MVGVFAAQIVDVQRHAGVIDEALKELASEVDIEITDAGTSVVDKVMQPRTTGEIDHYPRQRLVERHVGMAIATQTALVTDRLGKSLAEGDTDILDRVVVIDVGIAFAMDIQIDQTVTDDLVEHVIKERNAGIEPALTGAIKIDADRDLRFERVAFDFSLAHGSHFRRNGEWS